MKKNYESPVTGVYDLVMGGGGYDMYLGYCY